MKNTEKNFDDLFHYIFVRFYSLLSSINALKKVVYPQKY
jgi:hypothetical protein